MLGNIVLKTYVLGVILIPLPCTSIAKTTFGVNAAPKNICLHYMHGQLVWENSLAVIDKKQCTKTNRDPGFKEIKTESQHLALVRLSEIVKSQFETFRVHLSNSTGARHDLFVFYKNWPPLYYNNYYIILNVNYIVYITFGFKTIQVKWMFEFVFRTL